MKFTLASVAVASALFGSAFAADAAPDAAQTVSSLAPCAQDCIRQALTSVNCSGDDYSCGCQNFESLPGEVASCATGKILTGTNDCSISDLSNINIGSICSNLSENEQNAVSSAISNIVPTSTSTPDDNNANDNPGDNNADTNDDSSNPPSLASHVGGSVIAGVVAVMAAALAM